MGPPEVPSHAKLTGHCSCGTLTYALLGPPLATHCCHCTFCQCESGSAFQLNTWIESTLFALTCSTPPSYSTSPSGSGAGQRIARCPDCRVAVFSHYLRLGEHVTVIKAGTFAADARTSLRPDVHIFAGSKVAWLDLAKEVERGVGVHDGPCALEDAWSEESLTRWKALMEKRQKHDEEEAEKRVDG